MGYFKNQQIQAEDRRDYCHEECLAFAKWAKRNEDEMYSRYLRLEQRTQEELDFYDYLQLMWERQRHQDEPIIPS